MISELFSTIAHSSLITHQTEFALRISNFEFAEVELLKREQRLTSGRDFKAIFAGGKSYTNRLVVLRVMPKRGDGPSRFGFLTSSKLGNSVARNRAKRLLREAVRLIHDSLQQSGYDAVLIARPGVPDASFSEVFGAVEELFQKAGQLAPYKQSQDSHQLE